MVVSYSNTICKDKNPIINSNEDSYHPDIVISKERDSQGHDVVLPFQIQVTLYQSHLLAIKQNNQKVMCLLIGSLSP